MPDNELFSGIPTLDDEAGMQSYIDNAALGNLGVGGDNPASLQQPIAEQPEPAPAPAPAAPQYTSEQIAQIIARNQQLEAAQYQQAQAQAAYAQRQAQAQAQKSAYTPQQAAVIKQLIDRGVPLSRINAALQGNAQQNAQQAAIAQRLANMERYLQEQQYVTAQNEFIDKMTAFGDKFGLSENDLVTFGNKAYSMGINLTNVPDADAIEAVFRAVYPDQYAIRSQRLAGASTSQIYGGSSASETPRATSSKMEDAYVDQFLKHSMPNQYGMHTKK